MERFYENEHFCSICGQPVPNGRNICPSCALNYQSKTRIKVKLDEGAKMPTRAHPEDAGLDLYSRETKLIPAGGSAIFDTGVHVELSEYTVGMVKSKSGLNIKAGLLGEGVIDECYSGSIVVKLYNHSEASYIVNKGDKISQLVILPCFTPDVVLVDELEEKGRGNNGFGSTGK